MKIQEIYDLAIEVGSAADPRGKAGIERILSDAKKGYESLSDDDKKFFDEEKLVNPYADTRILYGDPEAEISNIFAGIDMEVQELLLADRLKEKGIEIDLVVSHHPEGRALAALDQVMKMQADIWHEFGVPINIGDVLMDKRAKEVKRAVSPINHDRPVDCARLLGIPLMCVHTPADNLVSSYLQKYLEDSEPYLVEDVVKGLRDIPEYEEATKMNAGPTIVSGNGKRRAGKVLVMMTGGTGGPEGSVEKLAAAGVGTMVEMHIDEKLKKKADEFGLNVVIAGHIASDNIGVNLFLDQLEERGIEVITGSGLKRFKR